ncbi:MAG: penicillin-binding protein 2 [Gemmatimonadaceae bacterium]|nr:penicillin-binding protein 2 [Gemmatimonadaceae bacterium]
MSLLANRPRIIHAALALFALAVIGRAAKVQLMDAGQWRARARDQQVAAAPLPAPRGTIRDVSGDVLVESREMVRLRVAPREVRDRAQLGRLMRRAGIADALVARATDTTVKWVEVPGLFLPTDVAMLTAMRGVHPEPVLNRVAPPSEGLRRIIGRTADGSVPVDGVELALDGLLRGEAGKEALLRDSRGRLFASPAVDGAAARPGHSVTLTINAGLQDIAERALNDAVEAQGAAGGDIVVLDARSGEVRALASRRADPRSTAATALTEPYEPGSTLKPFIAAWLLEHGRARVDEVVDGHNGKWNLNGRIIEDDHKAASFTFADVMRYSSNIGIIQFAQRLTPREQFEVLRDAGFGAPTGTTYPSESPGRLAPPAMWSQKSSASLAMGYEILVTPLQLAAAYAAIANGGELLQPALVREVRAPDGQVVYSHERRVVRRLMSPATARTMRGLLKGVLEGGTAQGASLATFEVAGKTGTAKVARNKRYVAGEYTASFVGMFPADDPQIVILVKLDSPRKSIYGGKAAAPVSKTVLEAAIAARDAALDRDALSRAPQRVAAAPPVDDPVQDAPAEVVVTESAGTVPYVVTLDQPLRASPVVAGARAVPSVQGLSRRAAAHALHRAGFRVVFVNGAAAQWPSAGTLAAAGSRVTVAVLP